MMEPSKSPLYPRHTTVGKCHAQTATDRFGDGAKVAIRAREPGVPLPETAEIPFDWPDVDSDEENRKSIYRKIPSMQQYRNNLTALSQVHNLYFVAYQSRIFVYRPRTVPSQMLPGQPDLQLYSRPDWFARAIGSRIDPSKPHTINNIMTGYLGSEEIILACYDDGHVLAYYVKGIAERVSSQRSATTQRLSQKAPRPFFQENVGLSAWGLAIHQRSRLIAVSSNRHEVTVFAFGLSQGLERSSHASHIPRNLPESVVCERDRDWRIVVAMGRGVDNIPNICFIDDDDGFADKICAIDIKGCIWIGDIWKSHQAPICIAPLEHSHLKSEEFFPSQSRGWGILAIPESSFIHVKTKEELFGLPLHKVEGIRPNTLGFCFQPMVNVRQVLDEIEGNPCRGPSWSAIILNQPPPMPMAPIEVEAIFPQLVVSDDGDDEGESEDSTGTAPGHNEEQVASEEGGGDESSDQDDDDDDDEGEEEEEDEEEGEEGEAEVEEEEEENESTEDDEVGDENNGMFGPINIDLGVGEDAEFTNTELPTSTTAALEAIWSLSEAEEYFFLPSHEFNPAFQSIDDRPADSLAGLGGHVYFPGRGLLRKLPESRVEMLQFLRRPLEYNALPIKNEHSMAKFGNRLHLLRTYEKDIEMRGFPQSHVTRKAEVGVVCPDAIKFGLFRNEHLHQLFQATSRLNMIAHAPELGLVAIGSATGRVLLLTLTRMVVPAERPEGAWNHGFRVERILPTRQDEKEHRKTLRPLHGMAMGPMQGEAGSSTAFPRKYRLMLHYRNHDILTYEISRDEKMGKLCIF